MIPLIWRRGGGVRLLLALAALALGGGAVLGTQLTAAALQGQAAAAVAARAGSAQYDIQPFGEQGFTAAETKAVSRLPAVALVAPLEQKADLAQLPSGGFRQVVLVAAGAEGVALRPLPLVRGRAPSAPRQVAVSQDLAPGLSLSSGAQTPGRVAPGQRLRLVGSHGSRPFRVVGVVSDSGPGAPFTEDSVYVTPGAAASYFGAGLRTTDLAVRLRPGADLDQLLRQLPGAIHTQFTVSDPRSLPDGDPAAELRPILDAVTALSLGLALVVIGSTLGSLVAERRREVGLLRVAGASPQLVVRSFLREALLLACLGGLLGVGAGYLLAQVLLWASAPAGSQAAISPEPAWSAGTFLLVLFLGLAAAFPPALRAASLPPLLAAGPAPPARRRWWLLQLPLIVGGAALAYLAFSSGGSLGVGLGAICSYVAVGAALSWVGPFLVVRLGALLAPLVGAPPDALAIRTRARPAGTWLALLVLFVSVATATGLVGLTGSALGAGSVWVDHLFVGQYLVVSPTPQSRTVEEQLLARLRHDAGASAVQAVAPVRFLDGRVGHQALEVAATAVAPYSRTGALQFLQGSRGAALREVAEGRAVLLPLELAQSLGARVGSELQLEAGSGSARLRVAGVVAHTLPGPSGEESLLLSQTAAERHFGAAAGGFDLLQLQLRGPASISRHVSEASFQYGMEAETVSAVRQGVDQGVENDVAALSALALVGVVIAILAAADTLLLGARSGGREMALLRVVGTSSAALRRAVVGEALATALVGALLGAAAGIGLIAPEAHAASSPALPLTFQVPLTAVLVLLGAVVVAILLAALAPARRLANLDPMAALLVE